MSVEFDTPANRIIQQLQPKNKFRIDTNLPDIAFLRQLSIQGRLRYFRGTSTGAGTPVTITPNVGETIFIHKLILSARTGVTTNFTVTNDGQTRLLAGQPVGAVEYSLIDSLVGDNIKTITVTNDANNVAVSVLGWSENTSRIRDVTT